MAKRRVQLRAVMLHRAAVAAEHDDVVTAADEPIGRHAEAVDGGEQPAEYILLSG